MADICLIPQIYNAKRIQIDMNEFPTLNRIWETAQALEEFEKSKPESFEPK